MLNVSQRAAHLADFLGLLVLLQPEAVGQVVLLRVVPIPHQFE